MEQRLVEFFQKRGYSVTTPMVVRGLSGFNQTFDLFATKGEEEIALDVASAPTEIGAESVVGFFAKIFDTKPQRPILICMPALNHDAKSLVKMYKIENVTANDMDKVVSSLTGVFGAEIVPNPSANNNQPASTPHQGDELRQTDRIVQEARERMARLRKDADSYP